MRVARGLQCIARMCASTISWDAPLAALAFELARLERGAPDLAQLRRAGEAAEDALDELERVLDDPLAELGPAARAGYLAALALVNVIEALPRESAAHAESLARFGRTAMRMLDSLQRIVTPEERALARRLLRAPAEPVREVARARA